MAGRGNGTTQYSRTATAVTASANYSYAFWYQPPNVPNTTDTRIAFGLVSNEGAAYTATFHAALVWDFTDVTIYKCCIHRGSNGTDYRVQFPSPPTANVWSHIAVTQDGSNLRLYLNGVQVGSTACVGASVANNPFVTTNSYNGVVAFDDAYVSGVTVWNTALTAAQVLELSAGTDPTTIANANITFNAPMNAASDETIGPNFVNSGLTFNQTFFTGMIGGPSVGGPTPTIHMIQAPEGGLAIGGGFPTVHSFTMNGGLSIGGNVDMRLILGNGSFVMIEDRGSASTEK